MRCPSLRASALLGAVTVLVVQTVFSQGQPSLSYAESELLSGPWEMPGPDGIDGIHLLIRREVDVRLYHRQGDREDVGWYRVGSFPSVTATLVDGHLHIVHSSNGTDVDVTFVSQSAAWRGSWQRGGRLRKVELRRPSAFRTEPRHPLVGTWEGLSDPPIHSVTTLHLEQSQDGAFTAWLDRAIGDDRRYGEPLRVIAVAPAGLTLQTDNATGNTFRYEGELDSAGLLSGLWARPGERAPGDTGTLNASIRFRRR